MVDRITLFEDFRCPYCKDSGIAEVTGEPAFGLESRRHEPEWRVCQCRRGETPATSAMRPDRAARRGQ